MTLADAFHIHTRKLHRATLRPFLGWRVREVANDIELRSTPFPRVERKGGGSPAAPHICSFPSHTFQHSEASL